MEQCPQGWKNFLARSAIQIWTSQRVCWSVGRSLVTAKQKSPLLFPNGLELRSVASPLAEKPCHSFSWGHEAFVRGTTLLTSYLLGRRKVGPSSATPNLSFTPYNPKCNKICGYSVFLAPAALSFPIQSGRVASEWSLRKKSYFCSQISHKNLGADGQVWIPIW